jgi:hypothetical protein
MKNVISRYQRILEVSEGFERNFTVFKEFLSTLARSCIKKLIV